MKNFADLKFFANAGRAVVLSVAVALCASCEKKEAYPKPEDNTKIINAYWEEVSSLSPEEYNEHRKMMMDSYNENIQSKYIEKQNQNQR
jgi:hypothetical protein